MNRKGSISGIDLFGPNLEAVNKTRKGWVKDTHHLICKPIDDVCDSSVNRRQRAVGAGMKRAIDHGQM